MNIQRGRRSARCTGCSLPPALCVCDRLPRVRFSTPLVVVQHSREEFKPTNTGRLLARMVESATLLPYGMRTPIFDPGPIGDFSIDWHLLYLRKDAQTLSSTPRPAHQPRLGLVLLDGSWSQCSHMARRLPSVARLPCVALPPGPPSFWTVRSQHLEGGRSTFEAAMRALELLEGAEAVAPLRSAFALVTARMLFLKGRLPSPEIPSSWVV